MLMAAAEAALFLYCLLAPAVLYVFTKHLLNKFRNHPPSPFPCWPVIGHLHLLKQPVYRTLAKISGQLGPVFLLKLGSRQLLVVSSPSAAEECFTKNDIAFANRPRMAVRKHMHYDNKTIIWASYGDHWRNLRRISALEILSAHRIQNLHAIRREEIMTLLGRLFRDQGLVVDMRKELFELTLNIMMRMLAGKRYYGENLSDVEEAERFRAIHAESSRLGGATNIGDFLPWLRSKKLEKKLIECGKKRDEFMQILAEEYRRKRKMQEEDDDNDDGDKRKKTSTAMVQVLLSLQEKEPEYYTDEIIKALILTLLLAGTDTTVATMEWALSLLINHPEVLKMAQMEIEKQVGHDRLVDEKDLPQLPYLRNIINETMRMYPAAPLLIPHESSTQCTVGGYDIPPGTMLSVNIWAMQNDPKVWEDPTKFMPERFEGPEGAAGSDFRLLPFGLGRRSCPGEGLAWRVVGLTLGSLIQCFELENVSGELVDMTGAIGASLRKGQPLKVICRSRPRATNLISQI